ncbi:MAG: ATP-binding protein [Desulfovibrionaceae bacterium]
MTDAKYTMLRWKIMLPTLLFSLVPLLWLGFYIHFQFEKTYTEKVTITLRTTLESKKKSIDLFLNEKIDQVKMLAQMHTFANVTSHDYLHELFNVIHANSKSFIDIGVIDQEGKHVSYIGPYNLIQANYKDEAWFHEVLVRGVYISDVFLGFRNYPHIILAVTRREGGNVWILRLTLDLNQLNSLVQSVQLGQTGDAYLLDQNNKLQTASRFYGPPHTEILKPKAVYFPGTQIENLDVAGRPRLVGMIWLDTIKWMLVISEDPSEMMSPLMRTRTNLLLLTLCGCLIIFTGSFFSARQLVRKIVLADRETAALDAQLMQQSKMAALGKMAAGVAHEINNPLTLIRESAGWMRDLLSEESPEAIENYEELVRVLDKLDLHVERAKGVTHRMLGFGRRMEPRQDNVNLNQLMDETLKFLESEAMHRNIHIVRNYDQALPPCTTDPNQIQQVMLNLVDNAIDAVQEGGSITVATGKTPDEASLYISVIDTGPGIAKDKLEKLFDPFFTTKLPGEGAGLGLSIVYGILEKLGGHIEVHSEEGKGSTFTFTLPRNS